jgi:hypothetical protein
MAKARTSLARVLELAGTKKVSRMGVPPTSRTPSPSVSWNPACSSSCPARILSNLSGGAVPKVGAPMGRTSP